MNIAGMIRDNTIKTIEFYMRLWCFLNINIYSMKKRILNIHQGRALKSPNKFALLVLYIQNEVPSFTQTLIDAIDRSDINLVLVSNKTLTQTQRDTLGRQSCLIIERKNLGRDFGAYRDGLLILKERFSDLERVILMNDSNYYFEKGLDALVRNLDGEADVIGLTEVFEHHYHVQSFMISLGRGPLSDPKFWEYWKNYLPISTRRWSIHKGEVGFSKLFRKRGYGTHILFRPASLIPKIKGTPIRELLDLTVLFPTYYRQLLQSQLEDTVKTIATIDQTEHFHTTQRRPLKTNNSDTHDSNSPIVSDWTRWIENNIYRRFLDTITVSNQMHLGGFVFYKFLDMPAIKRDIVYRNVYRLNDVEEILKTENDPLVDDVMIDLRKKGLSTDLRGLSRFLHDHGSI